MVLGEKEPLLIWLMMFNLDIWICRSLLSCIHGIQWLRNHWRSVFHELVNELNVSMKRKPIINCFFLLTSWLAYLQFQICWYRISSTRFVIFSCRPTTKNDQDDLAATSWAPRMAPTLQLQVEPLWPGRHVWPWELVYTVFFCVYNIEIYTGKVLLIKWSIWLF